MTKYHKIVKLFSEIDVWRDLISPRKSQSRWGSYTRVWVLFLLNFTKVAGGVILEGSYNRNFTVNKPLFSKTHHILSKIKHV